MTIKTYEDGWDCVPELKDVVEAYKNMKGAIYEIENCVRQMELGDMIRELKDMCYDMERKLDEIDDSLEFITVDDDGE